MDRHWSAPRLLSAGIILVRWRGNVPLYLLLRAYRYWDFPKGTVESGEEPFAAAIREVREETALSALAFPWGRGYRETPPYSRNKVARYYLAEVVTGDVILPVNPELGRPEHHEFRWLQYSDARTLVAERVKPILDWAHAQVQGATSQA